MTIDVFKERFSELSTDDRLAIYNEYCLEHGDPDRMFNSFDDEFFDINFSDKMSVARAVFFGKIQNWSDEYIRFNAYGNLESFSMFDVDDEIDDYVEEIFDHPIIWSSYIDDDEDDSDDSE